MAVYTYEDVIPSLIENTVMQKRLRDGVHRTYVIAPADGFVLHDNGFDYIDPDGNVTLGYASGSITVAANYDFVANSRELYAVPADSVPADQIYGNPGGGNHEVM